MKIITFLNSSYPIETIEIEDSLQMDKIKKQTTEKIEINLHLTHSNTNKEIITITLDIKDAIQIQTELNNLLLFMLQSKL